VATKEGLAIAFEIFDGNRPDVRTPKEMVAAMETNTAKPTGSGSWTGAW
jgi:hypothetical protein